MQTDHIPAPADHAPRKETVQQADDDLLVYEPQRSDSAWMLCKAGTVEVRQ
jgi:hypothetical protein